MTRSKCRSSVKAQAERDSAVGIATRYELYCSGIEPQWGRDFSAPVQTGSRTHTASRAMGTQSPYRA